MEKVGHDLMRQIEGVDLSERLTRPQLETIVGTQTITDLDISMLIFAWGGMREKYGKVAREDATHWLPIVHMLRTNKIDYLEAYRRFNKLSNSDLMRGCGPAYYTKLIFFLTRLRPAGKRGFIMDQWTARSINLLTGTKTIRLKADYNSAPENRRYIVLKDNDAQVYRYFCNQITDLAKLESKSNEDIRPYEERVEMRLFSEGRKKGAWREYVICNDR